MTYNSSNKQPRLYIVMDELKWRMNRTGFGDGFLAGLMVSVFSVLMAYYLVIGL